MQKLGWGLAAFLILVTQITTQAVAQKVEEQVDLALVLAIDVSRSTGIERWVLQRLGYANAFRSSEVVNAIAGGENQKIAVTVVQWSSPWEQWQVFEWTVVRDRESAAVFADQIEDMPRAFNNTTAIAAAIDSIALLLDNPPFTPLRKIIDISGDGADNTGDYPSRARNRAVRRGITINGLPIIAEEKRIAEYYRL